MSRPTAVTSDNDEVREMKLEVKIEVDEDAFEEYSRIPDSIEDERKPPPDKSKGMESAAFTTYSFSRLLRETPTEEDAIKWIFEKELVPSSIQCPICSKKLFIKKCKRIGVFRCCKKIHQEVTIPAGKNTFFEKARLPIKEILRIIHCFSSELSYNHTRSECTDKNKIKRPATISDWFSYLREVCMVALERKYEWEGKIGGEGHTVEIEKCKFSKIRNGVVEESMVLGIVDKDTSDVRLETCPYNCRESLEKLIDKHVQKGTRVITDSWEGYPSLNQMGYIHTIVNCSENLTDADTGGFELNRIALNHVVNRYGVRTSNLHLYLCEYLWRLDVKRQGKDPFVTLIDDIKTVYPGGS